MCSWCYAFAPVWGGVREAVGNRVTIRTVLGGLAPDTDAPMPGEMCRKIRRTWQRIEEVVPGTAFNYAFWSRCQPRRSTYPACRAVIAARAQGAEYEHAMVAAIQRGYYREARNPSLVQTLTALAAEIGLETARFRATLASEACERTLQAEIGRSLSLGVQGFPTLVLVSGHTGMAVQHDYNDAELTVHRVEAAVAALADRPAGR